MLHLGNVLGRADRMSNPFAGDKEKLSKMNAKQKFDYIWGYYKFAFIAVVIGIILIVSLVQSTMANNPDAISVFITDTYNEDYESAHTQLNEAFSNYLGLDEAAKEPIVFDASVTLSDDTNSTTAMASVQKLMAVVMSGSMELMITTEEIMTLYGEQGMFMNLEDALPKELFNELKEGGLLFTTTIPPNEDDEDSVEETYYCGIRLDGNAMLESAGYVTEGTAIGFVSNSGKQELALEFVKMLLDK